MARELDGGRYWCSVSTMYRDRPRAGQVRERRAVASHPPRVRPELLADGPNQVWSCDITALKGASKGIWYKCYVILDFSRYVPNWLVAACEDAVVRKDFIADAIRGDAFFTAYDHEHRHSGIGMHTPASVHYGTAHDIQDLRQTTLDQVYAVHPERFTRRPAPPA